MKKSLLLILAIFILSFFSSTLFSYTEIQKVPDSGDLAWILISASLVLLMIPGLAFFYGGMVRSKNILNTIVMSFICLGVITIQWVFFGYSIAFGEDVFNLQLFGWNSDYLFLSGIKPEDILADTNITHYIFIAFQGMFAVITAALISGAVAERMKFSAYLVFILIWATFVYDPICHWVWGAGWIGLSGLDAIDFAGGTVVHINSGVSALALVLVLGKRRNYPGPGFIPHNLNFTLLGAGLLWFGWFGFNAGSALAANVSASLAFVNTFVATAAGALSWSIVEAWHRKKASALGVASGIIAGLVAITPAAGAVEPIWAIVMGFISSFICYGAILLKSKLGYDDTLDVLGIHGIGGIWGALSLGIFATIRDSGKPLGLIAGGNGELLWIQFLSVAGTIIYAFIITWIIAKLLSVTMSLRVSEDEEEVGLDQTTHGETGYNF